MKKLKMEKKVSRVLLKGGDSKPDGGDSKPDGGDSKPEANKE